MRNVYLYIGLFMLFGIHCFGQNLQNANWYFGTNAGVRFNSGTLVTSPLAGSAMVTSEGCGAVSDQTGTLLFYSNGEKVWNRLHVIMPNGSALDGNQSSTQGVVIIPKPNDTDNYYLFVIEGITSTLTNGSLTYSEIDMSLNGGLGDVLPAVKNIYLQDHSTPPVSISSGNLSEKMTSAKHSNGNDYWLIAQVNDWVYSYLVSNSSITLTSFTAAPVALTTNYEASIGQMKISPDGSRIGIAYASLGNQVGGGNGRVALGSFNNSTGTIVFDQNLIVTGRTYGLEFSPDSQVVYFSNRGPGITFPNDISSATTTSSPISTFQNVGPGSMQLGIDGRIYVSRPSLSLSVITNPNNSTSPGINPYSVSVSGNPNSGLPQWVHWHSNEEPCTPLMLTSEGNSSFIYDNRSEITALTAYDLAVGDDVEMHARDFVVLQPNVHITAGAQYWASIEDCEDGGAIEMKPGVSLANGKEDVKTSLFSMYPNPSHDRVSLKAEAGITSVTITSLDGLLMYSSKLSGKETSHDVDVSRYRKGIYIVNITTADGKTESQKLMKD